MKKNIIYIITFLLFSQVLLSQTKHHISYWDEAKTIKKEEGELVNGKREGIWIEWHKNKKKYAEYHYVNGRRDGIQTTWHKNGKKKTEQLFLDDGSLIKEVEWDVKGKQIKIEHYSNGEIVTDK